VVSASCVNQQCSYDCKPGFDDCDSTASGCETNLLSNTANCGACGSACAGACQNGACKAPIATGLIEPSLLLSDSTRLYWAERAAGSSVPTLLRTMPKLGGTPTTLLNANAKIASLTQDATYLYFSTESPGEIRRVAKSDGSSLLLLSEAYAAYLSISGSSLYWGGTAGIRTLPLSGGAATTVGKYLDYLDALAVTSSGYFASDGSDIYWLGKSETVATSIFGFNGSGWIPERRFLAVAGSVFFVHIIDGTVRRTDSGPYGSTTTLLNGSFEEIHINGSTLYAIGPSSAVKVATTGGASSTLFGVKDPRTLTVDDTSVYVARQDALIRVPK
jgi:hypothetical protein